MSTRAQIKIDGTPILLYQHSDGYPSYLLKTLLPFLVEFHQHRGHDAEYLPAQLMARMIANQNEENEAWNKENAQLIEAFPSMKMRGPQFTGFGLDLNLHGDIEYLYEIDKKGTVNVRPARGTDVRKSIGKFPLGTTYEQAMEKLGDKAG